MTKYSPSRDLPLFARKLKTLNLTKLSEEILKMRNEEVSIQSISMYFHRNPDVKAELEKELNEQSPTEKHKRALNMANLHNAVIEWLTQQDTNCKPNHTTREIEFEGRIPDVVRFVNGEPIELIEIESVKKKELPPMTCRTLYFLVQGKWDKYAVIHTEPFREEIISKLILLENDLMSSISELRAEEEQLKTKVDSEKKTLFNLSRRTRAIIVKSKTV